MIHKFSRNCVDIPAKHSRNHMILECFFYAKSTESGFIASSRSDMIFDRRNRTIL